MVVIKAKKDVTQIAIGSKLVKFDAEGYAEVPKDLVANVKSDFFEITKKEVKKEAEKEDKKEQ